MEFNGIFGLGPSADICKIYMGIMAGLRKIYSGDIELSFDDLDVFFESDELDAVMASVPIFAKLSGRWFVHSNAKCPQSPTYEGNFTVTICPEDTVDSLVGAVLSGDRLDDQKTK